MGIVNHASNVPARAQRRLADVPRIELQSWYLTPKASSDAFGP
jgi:hypothetical protein